jgi:hypothetical protein
MNFGAARSWLAARVTDDQGIWPWAEHNQGFLSVAALVVALVIAVYEVKRAARTENRLLIEYIDWVLNCADRTIELTREAIGTMEGRITGVDAVSLPMWRILNANAIHTLEEIQPLRPTHPRLAHHVNRLLRSMAMEVKGDKPTAEVYMQLQHVLQLVEIGRDHVASFRPMRDRDRLVAAAKRLLRR